MKTLIIYGTYTGVTEDCAKELSKLLKGEVVLANIKDKSSINLNDYSTIIIGTSIRAGTINGRIKKFCIGHSNELMNKTLGIFTCGASEDGEALASLEKGVGTELMKHAKATAHFGGEFRLDKLNFMLKFIIKKVSESKGKSEAPSIKKNNIKEFANKLSK